MPEQGAAVYKPPIWESTRLVPKLCLGMPCPGNSVAVGCETEFRRQVRSQTEFGNEDAESREPIATWSERQTVSFGRVPAVPKSAQSFWWIQFPNSIAPEIPVEEIKEVGEEAPGGHAVESEQKQEEKRNADRAIRQ